MQPGSGDTSVHHTIGVKPDDEASYSQYRQPRDWPVLNVTVTDIV